MLGAHMRGAHGQPRMAAIDEREIDQLLQRLAQRLGRVVAGMVGAERHMGAEESARMLVSKKPGMPLGQRHP